MHSVSRQQQRLQPRGKGEVAEGSDVVIGEVDGFELVLGDAEVLDGGDLVTFLEPYCIS